MGRSPCCDGSGLKKGPWTPEEDHILIKYIHKNGHGSWRALPKLAVLNRCGKSCRLRWTNYLRPDIKRGKFSQEEEQTILNLHSILGNKWSAIATHLPGRTDNEIKNFWNTHMEKKLIQMGFDPMTHRPRTDIFSSLSQLIALSNLKELVEHQTMEQQAVRLQTEEATVQMAKLQYLHYLLQSPASMATFSNNIMTTTATDLDNNYNNLLNSLSSMKDKSVLNATQFGTQNPSSLGVGTTTLQSIHDSIPFAYLPNLQVPYNFQTPINNDMVQASDFTVLGQGENSPTSPWLPSTTSPSPSPSPPIPDALPPSIIQTSIGNTGDACSTSSYEAAHSSFWPQALLEDSLFHEMVKF